jgi:hypothetical protein
MSHAETISKLFSSQPLFVRHFVWIFCCCLGRGGGGGGGGVGLFGRNLDLILLPTASRSQAFALCFACLIRENLVRVL